MAFYFVFAGPWSLREDNVLELANRSARVYRLQSQTMLSFDIVEKVLNG